MGDEKQKSKDRFSIKLDSSSRFWKTFLLVLAGFLTFAGPTYIVYVLINVLNINDAVSRVCGIGLFITGLVLVWCLIRKKIIAT